jgi:glycerol uptake facilitator-like aquaporin
MNALVERKPSFARKIAAIILLAGSGGAVGYAAAKRLGLVGTVSAWGLGILMGLYFIASLIAALRRGLS